MRRPVPLRYLAFVRTAGRLDPRPALREATGDVLDAPAVTAAVAMISALGHSWPSPAGHDLHPGASHIIASMKAAGCCGRFR